MALLIFSSGQSHHAICCSSSTTGSEKRIRSGLAGTPADNEYGGRSLTTTEPAATTAPLPMVAPEVIVTPLPIHTSEPMMTSPLDSGIPSQNAPSSPSLIRRGKVLIQVVG